MKWTQLHDKLLVWEILLMQPWSSRKASTERGEVWLRIAASSNSLQSPIFRVNQRSVRDQYAVFEKKYNRPWAECQKCEILIRTSGNQKITSLATSI